MEKKKMFVMVPDATQRTTEPVTSSCSMRMERRFSGGAGGWNWIQSKKSVPSFNDLTSNNLPKVPYVSITNSLE